MSRTFVMVKPDGVRRGQIGRIMTRFEDKGLTLQAAKLIQLDRELAGKHYAHLQHKPFFEELVDFIVSGPVFAMIWEGPDAVKNARALIGSTNPADAASGTIRGDFATEVASNVVHGSDSDENAEHEIKVFFGS